MDLKEKLTTVKAPADFDAATDYMAGGGLVSLSLYADLTNGLHLLALFAGTILIVGRLIQQLKQWMEKKRRGANDHHKKAKHD